jgi:hypothetical protein
LGTGSERDQSNSSMAIHKNQSEREVLQALS